MSKDLIIALLALAFAGCAGALLVTLAKLDEQKQKTHDEHANYLAALGLHNAAAEALEQSKTRDCQGHIDFLNFCVETLEKKNDALQDRLSALLCPMNDHVWELTDALRCEVRCKKCGRKKDD